MNLRRGPRESTTTVVGVSSLCYASDDDETHEGLSEVGTGHDPGLTKTARDAIMWRLGTSKNAAKRSFR